MKTNSLSRTITLLSLFAVTSLFAQSAEPAATPAAATPAMRRPVRRMLPPEAFTTPTNYVLLVNHQKAVDSTWLAEQAGQMQRQLQSLVKVADLDEALSADPRPFIQSIRDAHEGKAKIVVVLSKDSSFQPILASPYEFWSIMNTEWVEKGGGDSALIHDRMGKRIYQALGHCIGAGYRIERESVMRFTPTPEALDDCLSHGFHPLNSQIFLHVQKAIGLDGIRLRPRKELIEMGILKPAPQKPATPEKTPTEASPSPTAVPQ